MFEKFSTGDWKWNNTEAEPFDITHTKLKLAEFKIDLREHDLKQTLFSDNQWLLAWFESMSLRIQPDSLAEFIRRYPNARIRS